jgi:hypothetical protein
MKQEITELYDEFTHRGPDRRMFMSRREMISLVLTKT